MPAAIVAGVLAGKSGNGGHAWTRVTWALGLRRLGFDVTYVETTGSVDRAAADYFKAVCTEFSIDGHLLDDAPSANLIERARDTELLVNIGGHLTLESLKCAPRVRVYVDDDPGYTQLWNLQGLLADKIAGHHFHFSYGENIARGTSRVPSDGIEWRSVRPPVLLNEWPAMTEPGRAFTTVGSWRGGYERVEWEGHLFGQKAHEFRRFARVPELVDQPFEVALDIGVEDAGDRDLLVRHGWTLVDPRSLSTPHRFRRFVQGSRAEFSAGQGIYVETSCGWFSDRTAQYLASGRPAVVQDTGFTSTLPTGQGLFGFSTVNDVVLASREIDREYDAHASAARALAVEHFDSDKVLGRLLEEVGL